jgi:gamma-glutamyltranspeptidase / glutathione hydrolase
MRGAVAAGHPLTAQAGAETLAEGGNAVDACIAAAFVSWVTESPLTGPGAGGFMLVHRARDRSDRILDFFVSIPGRGLHEPAGARMVEVDVPFDEHTTQLFRIGAAACAVPGAVAGLGEAHRLYARLPWADLVAPAIEIARKGVQLNPEQAFLHSILDVALRATGEGRKIYGGSEPLRVGDNLRMADLADTLEHLGEEGPGAFYGGELATRMSAAVRADEGPLTEADLASYRVIRRRPVRAAFAGHELVSNPPPSSGGLLIAFALRVLERLGVGGRPGSLGTVAALAAVMREASNARGGGFVRALYRGGLAERLLADERIEEAASSIRAGSGKVAHEPAGVPSTTHISVVDADGNAASLSASTGCGSGIVVPGTGIHLNNMLGETDLNPDQRTAAPGQRLTSMMAPSVVLSNGRPRLVVGSAGSIRLRAAILQIVVNVVAHGMSVQDAIAAPRVHFEGDTLHLEGGVDASVAVGLERRGHKIVRWGARNLYFGGASAVALRDDGSLEAAGDPRRGGGGVVVK